MYILIIQMMFYVSSPMSLLYYLNLAVMHRNNFPQADFFLKSSSNFSFQNVRCVVLVYIVYLNDLHIILYSLDRESQFDNKNV